MTKPLFPLGQVVATPGALAALEDAAQDISAFVRRHAGGDWGIIAVGDEGLNDAAVAEGVRIWIITEWDRSVTTVLLSLIHISEPTRPY